MKKIKSEYTEVRKPSDLQGMKMFTIKVQTVKAAAEKYFEDHLSKGEFVTEGEDKSAPLGTDLQSENLVKYYTDQPVAWHGKTAEMLGLKVGSTVAKVQFSQLLDNINPTTGKRLTLRTNKKRRLYFDVTSSAPKSVSVMALTMGDTRLIKAHEDATREALKEMEKYTGTRIRTGAQNIHRTTNNFLAASVTHTTSRANDPQLHTHNLIFNVTWDETEKKFKALEAVDIYNNLELFTENYRGILAKKVIELGYQIERAKYGWELKGVSREICEKFSKRSASMKKSIQDLEQSRGRTASKKEIAIIAEQTRQTKSKNLTIEKAIENQKSELTKEQLKGLEFVLKFSKVVEKDKNKIWEDLGKKKSDYESKPREPNNAEKEAVSFAIAHIFERQSIVKKSDLIALALKSNYGKLSQQHLEKVLELTPNLVRNRANGTVGTLDGLAKEYFITSFVQNKKNFAESITPISNTESLKTLRPDQKEALEKILKNRDQIMILEGGAGSGKSHILKTMTDHLKAQGLTVTATAPTTGATQNLTKDIGVEATTIQRILHKPGQYENALKNGHLIVDEAGLLSLNQMEALFMVADRYNTKVLLVGDIRQHHGVEAGDALRALRNYTNIEVAKLTEIERQKPIDYREAVREIQNENVKKGWELFEKMGVIHSKDDYLKTLSKTDINIDQLSQKLDYDKLYKTYLEKRADNKSVVVVTPTRSEVDSLTIGIRQMLGKSDLKDNKIEKEVYASAQFTSAEKMSVSQYIVRDDTHMIRFIEGTHDFEKNSTWSVKESHDDLLKIQNLKTDELKDFNPKEFIAKDFDVVEKKTIEIKEGETLLIQKNERIEIDKIQDENHKGHSIEVQTKERKAFDRFTNGELVKVKEIKDQEIHLEDGRKITDKLKHLDYGYVSTSYSAQGKTCDHVIVAMTNAGGRALSREQFYVSTSRGREGIDIFVEDKEFIKSRIETIGSRSLNLDFMEKEQREKIQKIQGDSIESLKEKSRNIAEKMAKELDGEKPLKTVIVEKTKEFATHWKEKLQNYREQKLEPIKDQISTLIEKSKLRISKELYPLEKEPVLSMEKGLDKSKSMGMDFDP